jgi:hypothetical protein
MTGNDHTTLERYEGTTYGVVLRRMPGAHGLVTHEYRTDRPDGHYTGHYFAAANESEARSDFAERMTAIRRRHDA